MVPIFILLVIYCFFQIKYYFKYGYIKETLVFAVIIVFSAVYLLDFYLELRTPKPFELISFILKPVSNIVFGID